VVPPLPQLTLEIPWNKFARRWYVGQAKNDPYTYSMCDMRNWIKTCTEHEIKIVSDMSLAIAKIRGRFCTYTVMMSHVDRTIVWCKKKSFEIMLKKGMGSKGYECSGVGHLNLTEEAPCRGLYMYL
jgi:hypothetical protein